jgi:general secretion pathway protein B
MSSILKALKKLENDTSLRKQEQLGIDARILQDGVSGRFSRTAVSLIVVAIFVCGSGATYFFMKQDAAKVTVPHTQSSQRETVIQPPVSDGTPPLLIRGAAARPATPPLLLSKMPPVSREVQSHPSTRSDSARQSAKESRPIQGGKLVEIAPISGLQPILAPTTTAGAGTRPSLTINGIAFQDGGVDNLAVINGVTVSSGAVIEGVKVEEIQKDRVRFSQGGEKFEIILNRSNR